MRLRLLAATLLLSMMALCLSWGDGPDLTTYDMAVNGLTVVWFASSAFCLTNLFGILYYGWPKKDEKKALDLLKRDGRWAYAVRLTVSWISRGENSEALLDSISRSKEVLDRWDVPYVIEAITDVPVNLPEHVKSIVVPESFVTERGSGHKARALQYAALQRSKWISDRDWVLHMDEESVLTDEALAGCHKLIEQTCDVSLMNPVIGQGEIQYNSLGFSGSFINAVDSIRTGDDLGRFRLQYKLFESPLFGMHGSYILLPAWLECKLGYDVGPRGSLTEDAYFALKSFDLQPDVKFKWVDGPILEQSPHDLSQLARQRGRWFRGLMALASDASLPLSRRAIVLLSSACWSISWLSPLVLAANLMSPGRLPLAAELVLAAIAGSYLFIYLVGAWRNMEGLDMSFSDRLVALGKVAVLVVPASAVEAYAVAKEGWLNSRAGFFVVSKKPSKK